MMESELPYLIDVVKACKKEQASQQTLKMNTKAYYKSSKHNKGKKKQQQRHKQQYQQAATSTSQKQPFQQPSPFEKAADIETVTSTHTNKKIVLEVGTRIGRKGIRITPLELDVEEEEGEENEDQNEDQEKREEKQ